MRTLALALAASALAACHESTSPTTVPFQLSVTTPTTGSNPTPKFTGTSNSIVVTARFVAPTPCYDLSAGVSQSGSTIDITVVATLRPGTCVASVGTFDYTIALAPIAPGSYHILVHHVGEASFTNTTFTGDVTVP
jgi:hypothetical protein